MEGASIAVQRFLESFGRVNGQLDDQALQPAKISILNKDHEPV
jgi:hypothetical protein